MGVPNPNQRCDRSRLDKDEFVLSLTNPQWSEEQARDTGMSSLHPESFYSIACSSRFKKISSPPWESA